MKNTKPVYPLLVRALKRKQITRKGYSRQALARDLGVSAAFVTNLLNGKKLPPKDRLSALCRHLELDVPERLALYKAVLLGGSRDLSSLKLFQSNLDETKRKISSGPISGALANWWNLAVLEGLSLETPYNEVENLRRSLGISRVQLDKSLLQLKEAGAIEYHEGLPVKKETHLYIPTGRSKAEIRAFHEQMILKARQELTSKTLDEDFHRRLITGFTFALNPNCTDSIKQKILKFLDEIAQEASQGECHEVYQCNVQFFPLTSRSKPL